MTERPPKHMTYDPWLFFTAMLLVVGGLFMVGSSSNYIAMLYDRSPSAFYLRQGLHVAMGFVGLVAAMSLRYRELDRRGWMLALYVACLGGLAIALLMPSAGGAQRWLPLGPFKVQPSEFAKLFVVLFLAYTLSRREQRVNEWRAVLLPCGLVVGSLAGLIYVEPDLGTAAMVLLVAGVMLFAAGLSWKTIGVAALVGAIGFGAAVQAPYRWERVVAWKNLWIDPGAEVQDANWQLAQSLVAIGGGGVAGVGLGQGQQKAYYVPAAHTDFIFSVVGEELGLKGTGLLLLAFLVIFWRGMRAAVGAPDRFGFYLALGITALVVLQALTNMAVCLGLLPTKGLSLPLISYGGSSLLASMLALGLLLNVSQHSN